MTDDPEFTREGALRCVSEDGIVLKANPGDPLFSTVSMFATEYFARGKWMKINLNEGTDNA